MTNFDSTSVFNFMNLGNNQYAGTAIWGGYEVIVTATVPEGQRLDMVNCSQYANWKMATEEFAKTYREWYATIKAKRQLEADSSSYEEEW